MLYPLFLSFSRKEKGRTIEVIDIRFQHVVRIRRQSHSADSCTAATLSFSVGSSMTTV